MEYGKFDKGGAEYVINTPNTPDRWFNYLFNDEYYMEVSQIGQGKSMCLAPSARDYTRGYRYFYLYDHGDNNCWNPAYAPLKEELDFFECIHRMESTEFNSEHRGIKCSIKTFVPVSGTYEIWTCSLKNTTQNNRDISLFSVFSFENGSVMGSKGEFDKENEILSCFSFPYHVYYEDKAKVENQKSLIFMVSDKKITSFDCSERRFFGGSDITVLPQAIINERCSNTVSEAENPVGAFEHRVSLKPGEELRISIAVGCAGRYEEMLEIKNSILRKDFPDNEFKKSKNKWDDICNKFKIDTPDCNLNYLMNFWLKKQVVLMARNNRLSNYCPVRNQLQDAMGYSILDVQGALELMFRVFERQESNGFIQQWYMTDNSAPKALCLLKHMDGPIWLITCMCTLINQSGDAGLLDMKVSYKNSTEKASIYEHMLGAAYYLAGQRGQHGLVLMGDGDWTDPINGIGRLGRGESAWSTAGLKYAAQQLLQFAERRKDTANSDRLSALIRELDLAINENCWDGDWYIAGYDDFGNPFGTSKDEEGKIFLNTQTWAIMSNTAIGERLAKCKQAIEGLDTPCGPLLLAPAFSGWNAKWGRISIKLPGTTENGSIYCHASMFKAFADCTTGDGDSAYNTIKKTLPTNDENPPDKSWQVPLFVPNYYFGLMSSPNFGHSSQHHNTGTAAWLIWVVLEHVLGAKATVDGLVIAPCIPGGWRELSFERSFKEAKYHIKVRNNYSGAEKGVKSIYVNNKLIDGNVLPYEEGVSLYEVEVNM